MADDNVSKYLKKGLDLFNKGKDFVTEKGGNILSEVRKNMEEKAAAAQNSSTQPEWKEKSAEQENSSENAEENAQPYQANINKGNISLTKRENNEEYVKEIASSQSVTALVCGILGLLTSITAPIWFLAFIPLIFCIIGFVNGKKATRTLPPINSMVARSGMIISLIGLIITILLLLYGFTLTYSSYYIMRSLFS